MNITSAEPVSIKVCGEGANETQATENGRQKAVKQVLLKILQDSNNPIFQQILNNYANFASKLEISKKQKNGSTLYLFGQVLIDPDKIIAAIKAVPKSSNNGNNVACFFIRVQGINDSAKIGKYQHRIRQISSDAFQRLGFKTAVTDELNGEIAKLQSVSYEEFYNTMISKIKQDYPEVTVAIIGEVNVSNAGEDAAGFARDSVVRIKAIAVLSNSQPIDFSESYRVKRTTADEADMMAIEKAAINSAETLASKVLSRL